MREGCLGNCLICGKCGSTAILDSFKMNGHKLGPRRGFGIAVDIGTSTVVLALLDLEAGKTKARHSFLNPQREFGADVISRINAANEGKLESLNCSIKSSLLEGIQTLLGSCEVKPEQICDMVIAGNTTMTYLLLGFPCKSLGAFPFKPELEIEDSYSFSDVFASALLQCSVHIMPWMSAFVGGDITAGLLHVLFEGKKSFVLIDLGTNGEMALYDNGNLTITATAAGPAFEGGERSGGASAVMDDLAALVLEGFVDETGRLSDKAPPLFSQEEIRRLQLAKSAVRAGLEILLEPVGFDKIESVYLAGGIGQAMKVESAVKIGLLPKELESKVCAVGNASLGGAVDFLISRGDIKAIRSEAVEINLSNHPRFNDYFMDYMCFEG